jgi:hypothetical protein
MARFYRFHRKKAPSVVLSSFSAILFGIASGESIRLPMQEEERFYFYQVGHTTAGPFAAEELLAKELS